MRRKVKASTLAENGGGREEKSSSDEEERAGGAAFLSALPCSPPQFLDPGPSCSAASAGHALRSVAWWSPQISQWLAWPLHRSFSPLSNIILFLLIMFVNK